MALATTVLLAACSSTASAGGGSASASSATTTVGFIMVGSTKDAGYNEAVADGAAAVKKDLGTSVNVLTADQIPENNSVTQTMQAMVDKGATVLFATSYGYFTYALNFAIAHPKVTVLHQGGFETGTFPPNFGTYWGQAYDPVGLGGMAAGGTTKTNKLGFIYAFPIPQTIANIDAFELGAQLVNPAAETYIVNTSNWCDPLKQKQAVTALLAQGADVFSQHQDCQSTVIQAVKAAGKYVVGYHYDAQALDPSGWLTGSAWSWAPIYEKIIGAVQAGSFTGGPYNANWIGSFATGDNPLELASFGTSVTADLKAKIEAEKAVISRPDASIFAGPLYCQDGSVLVPAGHVATAAEVNAFSCLIKGVVGTLPKS
ncbi:MAG TPA: BMP family ABC transporter substrate-binding protein [Cellulomonadaceae bacterium]|nr:BMP family ABC transporter substrate-binding protein [Cellulomonadaceae bacterium]